MIALSLKEKYINKDEFKSLAGYFLTALIGSGLNFILQIPFRSWFSNMGMEISQALAWSVFCAYMIATIFSFLPAKVFAFSKQSTGNTKREWVKFFIIAVLALGVQELVTLFSFNAIANTYFSEYSLLIREKGSHLLGMGCSFVANFVGHRVFTFRNTGIYDKLKSPER